MKKILALLIALVCVSFGALTACGGNPATGDNGGENDNGQTDSGPADNSTDGQTDGGHQCSYSSTWTYDGENHWHASICSQHPGNRADLAPHIFVNNKCMVCGREEVYGVGDKLPDFTVETFNSAYTEGTFSSANARGKVLVINFWYTSCGVCVEEMPEIEEVKRQYGDEVVVIALHSSTDDYIYEMANAQTFIDSARPNDHNKTSWSDYEIIFGKDKENGELFKKCGGDFFYPITLVLDKNGVISEVLNGNIIKQSLEPPYESENLLKSAIENVLNG